MISMSITMRPESPSARLREIRKELNNRREVMTRSKIYMISRWNLNWITHGGIYGDWPMNSKTWKEGSGQAMVGDTGALMGYFHAANEAGKVTQGSVEWTFQNDDSQYSVMHSESGMPNPLPNHEPIRKRALWGLDRQDANKVVRIIDVWVQEKVVF